ncbi:glycosyltransferase family 25 protein [Alcanivorax sp. S6407]|uniref:glycosyltransferase family 25 protein n=1 Tax=Alcanivorax sp. S6407 TaxID=2926424 RepID=UPI001FF5FA42|nr:glycosyltransferase family 25 protein [Alcanivorax sp. S6407]MCK0152827.1 glycosyltransferase family 25 protein [Alcanivorax sp. S6407]
MSDFIPLRCVDSRKTEGAVPVAIISLQDAADRRSLLCQEGLPKPWVEHYWEATDLRNPPADYVLEGVDTEAFQETYHRQPLTGEVGCSKSHYAVIQQFVNGSSADYLLVLEDDIQPTSEHFLAQLEGIVRLLRQAKNTDFACHLGPKPVHSDTSLCRRVRSNIPGVKLNLYVDKEQGVWLSHAYLIGRGAAERYLAVQSPLRYLCDDWRRLREALDINLLFVDSPVFVQSEALESHISADNQFRAMKTAKPTSFAERMVIRRGRFNLWLKKWGVIFIKHLWGYRLR